MPNVACELPKGNARRAPVCNCGGPAVVWVVSLSSWVASLSWVVSSWWLSRVASSWWSWVASS